MAALPRNAALVQRVLERLDRVGGARDPGEQAQDPDLNRRYGTRPGYQRISEIVEAAVSAAFFGADVEAEHARGQGEIDQFLQDNPGM